MSTDRESDKNPSRTNPDVFRVDILDLSVSAGPGIVNQEFVGSSTRLSMRQRKPGTCSMGVG